VPGQPRLVRPFLLFAGRPAELEHVAVQIDLHRPAVAQRPLGQLADDLAQLLDAQVDDQPAEYLRRALGALLLLPGERFYVRDVQVEQLGPQAPGQPRQVFLVGIGFSDDPHAHGGDLGHTRPFIPLSPAARQPKNATSGCIRS